MHSSVSDLLLGGLGGLVFAVVNQLVQWHFRVRKAMRFVARNGGCEASKLPVQYPHLTAAKLVECGWVSREYGFGRLLPTDLGRAAVVIQAGEG